MRGRYRQLPVRCGLIPTSSWLLSNHAWRHNLAARPYDFAPFEVEVHPDGGRSTRLLEYGEA